jgi:hypothetical protein
MYDSVLDLILVMILGFDMWDMWAIRSCIWNIDVLIGVFVPKIVHTNTSKLKFQREFSRNLLGRLSPLCLVLSGFDSLTEVVVR